MRRKFITFRRIIENGIINFMRNLGLSVAAMAVMVVTLTIVLFSIITNATFTHTIAQITDQIDVSVFLKDSNTEAQNKSLLVLIKKLPEVKKVEMCIRDSGCPVRINTVRHIPRTIYLTFRPKE